MSMGEQGISVKTFGQIVAEPRKALGISQKHLASRIRKEHGCQTSPEYLGDNEHDLFGEREIHARAFGVALFGACIGIELVAEIWRSQKRLI
jgi:transcriptional regulator with XRE-family HTH domain